MRKIEQDTIRAVRQLLAGQRTRPEWRKGNMAAIRAVDMSTADRDTVVTVYLHGNAIARVNRRTLELQVTLAGWDTVTTRSRLNALAYGLVQDSTVRFWRKKGITSTFIDSRDTIADTDVWYTVGAVFL